VLGVVVLLQTVVEEVRANSLAAYRYVPSLPSLPFSLPPSLPLFLLSPLPSSAFPPFQSSPVMNAFCFYFEPSTHAFPPSLLPSLPPSLPPLPLRRIKKLLLDESRAFVFFANEHHAETYR